MKETKPYYNNVKENDEVFGLVFGPGKVVTVFGDGHFTFEVEFENGSTVAYTEDGLPSWSSGTFDFQTIYYKSDIDLYDLDFSPSDDMLSVKKIIKLRDKKKLMVKCPSGIWVDINKCPSYIVEEYLETKKFYLFRKISNKS